MTRPKKKLTTTREFRSEPFQSLESMRQASKGLSDHYHSLKDQGLLTRTHLGLDSWELQIRLPSGRWKTETRSQQEAEETLRHNGTAMLRLTYRVVLTARRT